MRAIPALLCATVCTLAGGMCIASSSTTAVHALAYPLGDKYRIAHGVSNAILLP